MSTYDQWKTTEPESGYDPPNEIEDELPIRTWRAFGWHACRDNWDLGIPIGSGKTEAEAVADLIEKEENA